MGRKRVPDGPFHMDTEIPLVWSSPAPASKPHSLGGGLSCPATQQNICRMVVYASSPAQGWPLCLSQMLQSCQTILCQQYRLQRQTLASSLGSRLLCAGGQGAGIREDGQPPVLEPSSDFPGKLW